jgi:quercetin dioxygenase-like cupin family protein
MTKMGDMFEHPVFRERAVVIESTQASGGDVLGLEHHLAPRQRIKIVHVHPQQKERLKVLSGEIQVSVHGTERTLGSGQKIEIPSRARHVWWNAKDDEAVVQVEFRPALQMEDYIADSCALAQSGKVNPETGLPGPIALARLMHTYRNEIRPLLMPEPIQSAAFAILAFVGKLLHSRTEAWRLLRQRTVRLRP